MSMRGEGRTADSPGRDFAVAYCVSGHLVGPALGAGVYEGQKRPQERVSRDRESGQLQIRLVMVSQVSLLVGQQRGLLVRVKCLQHSVVTSTCPG